MSDYKVPTDIDFKLQYNSNYFQRYMSMRDLIKLPKGANVETVTISKVDKEICMTRGVLFVQSKKKHSILNAGGQVDNSTNNKEIACYIDDSTVYFAEDEACKVEINFKCNILNDFLVTGMVLGFVGNLDEGVFQCTKIIYPEDVPGSCLNMTEEKRLLIINNPKINRNFESIISLLDLYAGKYDDVLMIGPIFDTSLEEWDFSRFERSLKNISGKIYVVPDRDDPTTYFLPQTALHKMLFNDNAKIVSLGNPSKLNLNGKEMVILDQHTIIEDLTRYKQNATHIGVLKAVVRCRHMVPCAPDTIPSIPLAINDPFILEKVDFVISGGESLDFTKYHDKFLMTVPDFPKTQKAVLFHMSTHKVEELEVEITIK